MTDNDDIDVVEALALCESPMESAFCLELLRIADEGGPFFHLSYGYNGTWASGRGGDVYVQYPVHFANRFIRVDVAIIRGDICLAIEIDGFDFHDRTVDQAVSDRSRDRLLTSAGWTPVRFAGSEVNADPFDCAAETVALIGLRAAGCHEQFSGYPDIPYDLDETMSWLHDCADARADGQQEPAKPEWV